MKTMTEEMRRDVLSAGEKPVRIMDPDTNTEYVIVRADLFEQLGRLLAGQVSPEGVALLGQRTKANDVAEDPNLDSYRLQK